MNRVFIFIYLRKGYDIFFRKVGFIFCKLFNFKMIYFWIFWIYYKFLDNYLFYRYLMLLLNKLIYWKSCLIFVRDLVVDRVYNLVGWVEKCVGYVCYLWWYWSCCYLLIWVGGGFCVYGCFGFCFLVCYRGSIFVWCWRGFWKNYWLL